MDETKVEPVSTPRVARAGRGLVGPLLAKSVSLGVVAALIALGLTTPLGAAGAFVGCLAAGLYAAGYLSSHIGSVGRERIFDSGVARSAMLRMIAVAVGGFGAYAVGRQTFIAYLSAFGLAFGVLVISEIPRAKQALKTTGGFGGVAAPLDRDLHTPEAANPPKSSGGFGGVAAPQSTEPRALEAANPLKSDGGFGG